MSGSVLSIAEPSPAVAPLSEDVAGTASLFTRPEPKRVLAFTLAENAYCIASDVVQEITLPIPCSRLPGTPDHVKGIAPLRFETLAVIDLQLLLGLGRVPTAARRPKFIVLRSGGLQVQIAFEADSVTAVMDVGRLEFRPVDAGFCDGEYLTPGGGRLPRIDTVKLYGILDRA